MSLYDDVLDNATRWKPRMSPPDSFTRQDAEKYQKRIDEGIGTHDGRSIVKLAWGPDELRWYPYRMGEEEPKGYTFPIFIYGTDSEGVKVAAPRWVLLERIEPEQYARTWERGRYSKADGSTWDWKGDCPTERYIELRAHSHHDGECCPCHGDFCRCGQAYDHCWGKYLDPNERLLDWVKKVVYESRQDPDVQPTTEASDFIAPQAQRDLVTKERERQASQEKDIDDFTDKMADFWVKQPVSVNFKQTESGLLVPN